MAKQVLPIVGGVVGAFFGMPQLGFMAGSLLASAIPDKQAAPSLGELPVQKSEEGAPRAIVYGTAQCTGYILDFGPPIETTEYVEAEGGKGSSSTPTAVVYRNYAIAICEGPIAAVLRIWQNDKLVYDVRPGSLMLAESFKWLNKSNSGKNFFLGTEDQPPSVFLELNVSGIGTTPSYAGTAYMVFGLEDLTDTRGAIPQYRFEVAKATTPHTITLPRVTVGGRQLSGQTGGGTSINMVNEPEPMDAPGNVWLGYFALTSTAGAATVILRVGVAGTAVWQKAVTLPGGGGSVVTRVQINHVADGGLIHTAIEGGFTGTWTVAIVAISGDENYTAYSPAGPAPWYYSSDSEHFGIVTDSSGVLHSIKYITPDGAEAWGPAIWMDGHEGSPDSLAAIVEDLHDRCGIDPAEVDVSDLDDDVAGFTVQGDYDAAAVIDSLRSTHFFDRCEPGDGIYYLKRGKPVVASLIIDDLVEAPDLSRREQASEIPKKLHLSYPNPTAGYSPLKADSEIRTADFASSDEATAQTPVVMDADLAAQTVARMHKVMAADAQGEVKLSVASDWLALTASDCISLTLRGQSRRLRIEAIDDAEGVRELTCKIDRQSAYTSTVTGIPTRPPALPPSTIVGDSELAVLDISSRLDTEDDLHYLVAATGAMPGWYGWSLQRSLDGGANYTSVAQYRFAAVMGTLVHAVSCASEHFTDKTNVITVALYRAGQVIDSIGMAQFLSEGGAFALEKDDGSWEVLQYLDADLDDDGNTVLTTLHRGLLNSGASAHAAGARFVLLRYAQHVPAQSAWIGQALTNRAVSLDESPESGDVETITYAGRSQLEWPVAYLRVDRDALDVLEGAWTARHRFGTDDAPVASINFQGFRVTLSDGAAEVSFDTAAPSFRYDASALASPVTVSVSALNRITGPGPAVSTAA